MCKFHVRVVFSKFRHHVKFFLKKQCTAMVCFRPRIQSCIVRIFFISRFLATRSKCTFWGWFTPTSANFEPNLNGSTISLRGLLSNVAGFIEIKDFGLGSFPCKLFAKNSALVAQRIGRQARSRKG